MSQTQVPAFPATTGEVKIAVNPRDQVVVMQQVCCEAIRQVSGLKQRDALRKKLNTALAETYWQIAQQALASSN